MERVDERLLSQIRRDIERGRAVNDRTLQLLYYLHMKMCIRDRPFCDAIGHPEIKGDGLKRRWEAPEAFKIVEETIKSKTTDEWMEWLEDKDFCIAKVHSKTEAVEPVSYTHLDVYKRQETTSLVCLAPSRALLVTM